MDELEWLRKNSPPTAPSREVAQRHRTQLRAAIASEGVDGSPPLRPRRRLRSRHRVLVTTVVVLAVCAIGAGVVALTSNGGDGGRRVGAPAASGSTSTTTAPTCTGPVPADFAFPAGFGSAVVGPAPESRDPVEAGQQVTYQTSGKATFEIRWPADASLRRLTVPTPQRPDDHSSSIASDVRETVDDRGIAHRRSVATFPSQTPECQTVEITVYGKDADLVNALADAFNQAPYRSSQPLVTTTAADVAGPLAVTPCPGPVDASGQPVKIAAVKYTPTVGGSVAPKVFAEPVDALADFLAARPFLFQRGYQQSQLADGSLDFVAEPRDGVVVTLVHVTPSADGWTVSDWSASGC